MHTQRRHTHWHKHTFIIRGGSKAEARRKQGFVRDLAPTKKKCQEKPIFTNLKKNI